MDAATIRTMGPWEVVDWLIDHGPYLPPAENAPDADGPIVGAMITARSREYRPCAMCADGTLARPAVLTRASELFTRRRWLDLCQAHFAALMRFGMSVTWEEITDGEIVQRWLDRERAL